ncbi:hypothetical protein RHS01_05873 [Rhizoctonia solani]|uniref:Uncharacterized protein n=1 Tax=Rhizoctonia solani TaxID=456999 RepID=A0A8H7M479_9AGAM|nr:hypothetical protein RHS01_05873 [Rhizoctonia solani]
MYLVARTVKDIMSGRDPQNLFELYFPLLRQILETPPLGSSWTRHVLVVYMISNTTATIRDCQFVINDTIAALVLGTPPLLHYDSTLVWTAEPPFHYELVYGFPIGILLFFAKANAWRASQLMKQGSPYQAVSTGSRFKKLGVKQLNIPIHVKNVNSSDLRVESAVRQIVQLESVPKGNPQKTHFLVPCLLAGIAARQEKHRTALRSSVSDQGPLKINTLMLRGPDFVPVLDHLWHGVGSQGNPVTWEDYVQSRCSVLPI